MLDHLRDMGREIANQHSPSRLWLPQHTKQIEKRNETRGIKAVEWRLYRYLYEDRYPRLESLSLDYNHHLTEIETLPTTVKSIELRHCEMLKIIRISGDLQWLRIESCPEVEELPSFARLTSLTRFELEGCNRIEKIEGLEYCTKLERLILHTCWEMPGIESLEHIKKLREVVHRANKRSAIEHCIQTIQEWADEIIICTWAIPDASSVVDSFLDEPSSNGHDTMFYVVVNCLYSPMDLLIHGGEFKGFKFLSLEKGRWVFTGVFTRAFGVEVFEMRGREKIEKRLVVRGEKQRLVKAFNRVLPRLQS